MEDILWFTLLHKIGHIIKQHSKKKNYISFWDENNLDDKYLSIEKKANKFASEILIPQKHWNNFINVGLFSYSDINKFANQLKVKPGIIARKTNKWSKFSYLRTKIAIK